MQNSGDANNYYTENISNKEIFTKEYKQEHIYKYILEAYHTLHQYMAIKEKEVYFGDLTIDGQKIDTRKINILDLNPRGIYETSNIETKESLLITNPTYISGKTLKDYEIQLGKETNQRICDAITRYIETLTKINFTDMYGVSPINVKIDIQDNTAQLIVTDISCNIKNFFHSGKNAVILDELIKTLV